jgi:HEAT repeat protein
MAPTMEEVRRHLEPDEPRYGRAASALGTEALPLLEELAREADPLLASKAAYLAGVIGSPGAEKVLKAAAKRPEPEVRVAAAAGVGRLPAPESVDALPADAPGAVLGRLLEDEDPSVRKYALQSADDMGAREHVEEAARTDSVAYIREMAKGRLRGRRR